MTPVAGRSPSGSRRAREAAPAGPRSPSCDEEDRRRWQSRSSSALDAELANWRSELARLPRAAGSAPSPSNGYHSGISPQADVVEVGAGRPRPSRADRRDPPDPGAADRLPRHAGLRLPGALPRRGRPTTPTFATAEHGRRPHAGPTFPTPATSPTAFAAGGRCPLRPRDGDAAVEAHRRLRLRAGRAAGRSSGGKNVARGRDGDGARLASRPAAGASATSSTASTAADRLPDLADREDAGAAAASARRAGPAARARRRRELADRADRRRELRPTCCRGRAELAALDGAAASAGAGQQVYAVVPRPPRPIRVLHRGDVEQPGEPVAPGALLVRARALTRTSHGSAERRAAAARRWPSGSPTPSNPLTWRSIVNRVWHYHFGRGLVDTPNDFGRNGSRPTHPELLDWLAVEFRDGGGSLKKLHRLIVTQRRLSPVVAPRRGRPRSSTPTTAISGA